MPVSGPGPYLHRPEQPDKGAVGRARALPHAMKA
jgi:hypothetical protein